jgi:RNA polymerase sigma factor (sigma-70 family)
VAFPNPQTLVTSLVATHDEQLRRFLLSRLRNASDLQDVIQEVYLRMLRVPNSESIRSPEAYLFTVAQHVIQQHGLRGAATATPPDLARAFSSSAQTAADPCQELAAVQCLERLQAALEQFTPKVRAAFLMHRRDGLSCEEIGRRLGLSLPMVKKYLMKAVIQLRSTLDPLD